jgi:hypothetical protein
MISARAKRLYVITATVTVAVLVLSLSLIAPILSTTEDFSIYNTGWNGTSALAISAYRSGSVVPTLALSSTGSDLTVVNLPLDSFDLDPATSSLIIIGPSKPFTASEGGLVGDFVRNGGRLLLANDFGSGNSLLEAMDATSRFSGHLLMDLAFEKKPEFSVCFDIDRNNNITEGVTAILMNFATTIEAGENTSVIAMSSVASYQDMHENRLRDWNDPLGPFPVIAMEHLGLGQILLFSDPSIFINGMLGQLDNELLANNTMLFIEGGAREVFFDESHRNYLDPVAVSVTTLGQFSDFAKGFMVALIAIVLLTFLTEYPRIAARDIFKRAVWLLRAILNILYRKRDVKGKPKPLTEDELIVAVMERHPEWKRSVLRNILVQAEYHKKGKGW